MLPLLMVARFYHEGWRRGFIMVGDVAGGFDARGFIYLRDEVAGWRRSLVCSFVLCLMEAMSREQGERTQ